MDSTLFTHDLYLASPLGAKFWPEDVDPTLCTHMIYAFGKINWSGELATWEWNDDAIIGRVMALKTVGL